MKGLSTLLGAAVLAAFALPSFSQPATTGFHQVQCVKIEPGKFAEFRKWAAGDLHKYGQALVDSGRLSSWYVIRAVMPSGRANACDYFMVGVYPGLPPEPLSPEDAGALVKKAGLGTLEEFGGHRDALSVMVRNSMWQTVAMVGSMQKGDYLTVNESKAPDVEEWVAFEKKLWQPMAEQLDKEGLTRGWSVNVMVMPARGDDIVVNGVTVDVYPSWDAVTKSMVDPEWLNRFRKVHPDMEVGTSFEHLEKVRKNLTANLYRIDDAISSGK